MLDARTVTNQVSASSHYVSDQLFPVQSSMNQVHSRRGCSLRLLIVTKAAALCVQYGTYCHLFQCLTSSLRMFRSILPRWFSLTVFLSFLLHHLSAISDLNARGIVNLQYL
jgi:hypothetical protein